MVPASATSLRVTATILAIVVGGYASWLVAAETVRPRLPFFPAEAQESAAAANVRGQAAFAARLGLVRSDLWTDYAMTLAFDPALQNSANANKEVHVTTENAIMLGPHDARPWLLLARSEARLDPLSRTLAGPLKMSYFTGPNDTSLIPMRLSIATQSEAIADPDLQILATNDLRLALLRKPEMKPAIVAAYRDASPDGKRFIQTAIGQLDPSFLGTLQTPSSSSPN